jgi:hemerythrin
MLKMEFTPELATGIKDIDNQHRSLISWANAVFSMGDADGDGALALRAARFLFAYVEYHFAAEEYAMVAVAYPQVDRHRRQHAELTKQVTAIRKAMESGATFRAVAGSLHILLEDWLLHHIGHSDRDFARTCKQDPNVRILRLPSPKELRDSGLDLADYDNVQVVHAAGEISATEIKARLAARSARG